jgi:hypothetical protein
MPNSFLIPDGQARLFTRLAGGLAALTALITSVPMVAGWSGAGRWLLIDVAILLGLAYGMFRGSVAIAITLFIYFVGNQFYVHQAGGVKAGLLSIPCGAIYLMGVVGALSLRRQAKAPQPQLATGGGGGAQ